MQIKGLERERKRNNNRKMVVRGRSIFQLLRTKRERLMQENGRM